MMRFFTALLVSISACGPTGTVNYSLDTLPSGAIRVVNHGPVWPDTTGWRIVLEAEHVFPPDSAGSLDRPNYPYQLADGTMFVLNQVPPFIQRYAADFTPLGRFGRQGSGPGEFQGPAPRAFGDSIVVLDNSTSRLLLFNADGQPLAESVIPTFTDRLGARDRRGLLPLIGRYAAESEAGVIWWSLQDRRAVDSIIAPAGPRMKMWEACRFIVPFQPSLSLTTTLDGLAWFGISDVDRFILTSKGMDTVRVVENPGRPRFPVDQARVDEILDNDFMKQICGPAMNRDDIPKQRPAWGSLTVDDEDNLWVGRPAAYGPSYDVYDPRGVFLGEVPSPIGGGENRYWQGDLILTVEDGDEGGYTLRRYRIRR